MTSPGQEPRGDGVTAVSELVDALLERLAGRGFDPRLVGRSVIDTGPLAERAREVARRLNAVRAGRPKEPVVLWTAPHAAVTRRGPWIYVARAFVDRLSDDALAFVMGHEMAHHDLGHLALTAVAAARMGHSQRMELLADAHGLALAHRAGFTPRAALETFAPELWLPEEERDAVWPDPVERWLDRFRHTHPPPEQRQAALERLIDRLERSVPAGA